MAKCEECGFAYDETFEPDVRKHDRYHRLTGMQKDTVGFYHTYEEREKLKSEFYQHYPNACKSEKIIWAIRYFEQYFSRSLAGSGYHLGHPCFEEYASMLLYQNSFKKQFSEIYGDLINLYKPKSGIEEGDTYFRL